MTFEEMAAAIKEHQDAVAERRNKLDAFIDELSALRDSCDSAWDDMQRARDALSELV